MLKMGFVGVGMHLEFSTYAEPSYKGITTSEIQEVTVVGAESNAV